MPRLPHLAAHHIPFGEQFLFGDQRPRRRFLHSRAGRDGLTVWMIGSLLMLLVELTSVPLFAEDGAGLTFEKDIRPILKAQCFHCHGEADTREGGLDVRLVRLLQRGGDSGAALVPGDPGDSLLWQRIEADEMPEGEKKLTAAQKAAIRAWLADGAPTARPEPQDPDAARFTLEELSHWSYQPIQHPRIPSQPGQSWASPIDFFVGRKLGEWDQTFSPEASRPTLIRRLSFDLLGLPPSVQEVQQFVEDRSPSAYQRLVDRLLASPHYGERWARHWLDAAGYAETNGDPTNDTARSYAWRYRDYVIEAFNRGKSYRRFLLEQLSGDELLGAPLERHNTAHRDLLAATGFLRMAPDATQTKNDVSTRNTAVAESIKVISSAVLGVTLGCAQCHDHKYDPITIEDYYRFRAIFDPVFPLDKWQTPSARLVDFTPPDVQKEIDRIENEAQALQETLNQRKRATAQRILDEKLALVPAFQREAARVAVATKIPQRTSQQRSLLDAHPMVKPIQHIIGLLVEYDREAYNRFQKEADAIAALHATKPAPHLVMTTQEQPNVVPVSKVLFRGNPAAPGDAVEPQELSAPQPSAGQPGFPPPAGATSGRRLAYAHHLTSDRHPLTARTIVNRIWHHHFGRGLVATIHDLGISGDRPTHPELLDWLAHDLIQHDWDLKRLHRQIVCSQTYRQSSTRRAELDQLDPENIYLGRAPLRRLDAEALRDAILYVTDNLENSLGGPSTPVTENAEGKIVLGRRKVRNGLKAGVEGVMGGGQRRSLYIEIKRRQPLNLLATFDQPEMTPNCDRRRATTVATQSLWLLNDEEIIRRADDLARLLRRQHTEVDQQIRALFERLFALAPSHDEVRDCRDFLDSLPASLDKQETSRISVLCQTLLASNRFLYVD